MPHSPPTHRPHGLTAAQLKQSYERVRGGSRERGYDGRWERESAAFLASHTDCEYCALERRWSRAMLVDHLYPHRGNRLLFWRKEFWVACCRRCHDGFKQKLERGARAGLDALAVRLGRPLLT